MSINSLDLSDYLTNADQSVKEFIALTLEKINNQIKQHHDASIQIEYFSMLIEIRLLSFKGFDNQSTPQISSSTLRKSKLND